MISVSENVIEPGVLLEAFSKTVPDAGAVVSFTGKVRARTDTEPVFKLHLQAYEPLTSNGIGKAVQSALGRWPLSGVRVHHRTGDMLPDEVIVFVAAASPHRRAAFEAADYLMDYLKTEAVFWKKEVSSSGETWIEPREQDYADQARWR